MTRRNLPATAQPPTYYVQPAQPQIVLFDPAQIAEQRRVDELLFRQWKVRQAAIRERDERNRRLTIRIALVVLAAVFALVAAVGWVVSRMLAGVSAGIVLGLLGVGVLVLAGLGGRHCVTTITHRH